MSHRYGLDGERIEDDEPSAPVVSDARDLTAAEWIAELRASLAESAARRERVHRDR